jgi:hypothetical protein
LLYSAPNGVQKQTSAPKSVENPWKIRGKSVEKSEWKNHASFYCVSRIGNAEKRV